MLPAEAVERISEPVKTQSKLIRRHPLVDLAGQEVHGESASRIARGFREDMRFAIADDESESTCEGICEVVGDRVQLRMLHRFILGSRGHEGRVPANTPAFCIALRVQARFS